MIGKAPLFVWNLLDCLGRELLVLASFWFLSLPLPNRFLLLVLTDQAHPSLILDVVCLIIYRSYELFLLKVRSN